MSSKKTKSTARKPAQKKLTKKQQEQKSLLASEAKGFVLLFSGILLLYFTMAPKSGVVGTWVAGFLLSLFGYFGRAALASAVFLNGLALLFKKKGVGFWLYVFAFVLTLTFSISVRSFSPYSFSDIALYRDLWSLPSRGGFVCCLIAKLLKAALQSVGAYILLIAVCVVSFIVILKKSFLSVVKQSAGKVAKATEEIKSHIPSRTLDFDSDDNRRVKRQKKQDPAIELKKTKTVLETKQGDRLIYVKHGDMPKFAASATDMLEGEKSERHSPVNSKLMDDFSSQAPKRKKKEKPAESEKLPAFDVLDNLNEAPAEPEVQKVSNKEAEEAVNKLAPVIDRVISAPSEHYSFPPYTLLDAPTVKKTAGNTALVKEEGINLTKTLSDFGIEATIVDITTGPAVTRFELQLQSGTRVSKVANLQDDIAYALAAKQVRVEAPIPGKSAVGIEIPNKVPQTVKLSQIIRAQNFVNHKSPLAVALGETLTGEALVMDITRMPHLLIAGATGSGKSVCINTIIVSILYHSSPEDVKMILIDPKMVELNVYNEIPHLLIPVVTNPKEASGALGWAVREMEARYQRFSENRVKDIKGFNEKAESIGEDKMPHVVLIIDELSDLMMVSAQQVENSICRLAQLARAAGIHLVLATQRPSVNVITGLIKANIPSRISFAVTSQIDSRTILDMGGAEKLLGRGDMLYKPIDENVPIRAQCAFVSENEVENIVEFIKEKYTAEYNEDIHEQIKNSAAEEAVKQVTASAEEGDDDETLIKRAMEIAFQNKGKVSTSLIQRKLRLGYARAGRIVDEMEDRGYISAADGSKPREVLVSYEEIFANE